MSEQNTCGGALHLGSVGGVQCLQRTPVEEPYTLGDLVSCSVYTEPLWRSLTPWEVWSAAISAKETSGGALHLRNFGELQCLHITPVVEPYTLGALVKCNVSTELLWKSLTRWKAW